MATNKNSNTYIILYATAMVVVVAAILASTAMLLKPLQDANILNEKQSAILGSLGVEGESYDQFITAFALNENGEVIQGVAGAEVLDMLADLKGNHEAGKFPIFQAKDGRVVIPLFGNGLWNVIWGYLALESDMNTVAGIVLDHAGETPGLGAEISTAAHQNQYRGKKIFDGEEFVSVTLIKGGTSPSSASYVHEVDGISGGTKTADGVSDMLKNSLKSYIPYLRGAQDEQNEEMLNLENEENDEQ